MTDSASCDPTSVSAASLVCTSAAAEACWAASISACMVRMPANRSVHDSASMRPSSRSMASSWSWISGVWGRNPRTRSRMSFVSRKPLRAWLIRSDPMLIVVLTVWRSWLISWVCSSTLEARRSNSKPPIFSRCASGSSSSATAAST